MKIGFVFNQASIIGGGEISFFDTIEALRRIGVIPVALVPGRGEIEEQMASLGIPVELTDFPHLSPITLISWSRQVRHLSQTISTLAIDLLHVNGARSMLYAGPAAKRAGIPCVWHNRVLHRDPLLDRIRGHYADAVIANSSAVAVSLKKTGIDNVSVVYNGFDLEAMGTQKALDIHREFQVAAGVPIVLAVGRLSPWKGFRDLLDACALLNKKKVPFFCLIAGKSLPEERDHVASLLDMKEKKGLSNVHFAGWRKDVAALMKGATVLVVPSHGEPFGRIIIEGWASGLPVVATNTGGPAELIKNSENGRLVPVGDPSAIAAALEELFASPGTRAAFSAAGRVSANGFSLIFHRDAIMTIYRKLLRRNGTATTERGAF